MTTLGERLRLQASKTGDAIALHLQHAGHPDVAISYRDLLSGSMGFADLYSREGLAPGEVVVLIHQHGAELVHSFWGAILQGVVPSIMPYLTEKLAPEQYRNDLASLIKVTRPAAVVTYPEFEDEVRSSIRPGSTVRRVIVKRQDAVSPHSSRNHPVKSNGRADDIALLQHSSGTTGLQKGVALSHRAILNQLEAYGRALQLSHADVIVSWLPLYHDMGLIAGFLMPILAGIPLVLGSPFDWIRAPWRLMEAVSRYRGTLTWLPNFAYNFSAQKVRDRHLQGMDLSSWRGVINCSEPVRLESHRIFYERFKSYGLRWEALQTSYAMAENVFGVTQSDLSRPPTVQSVDREAFLGEMIARPPGPGRAAIAAMSSGVALPNTQVEIHDAHGHRLPDGHIGEIVLRSDCMLTGYYNRPDADHEAFQDGWYLTGDYGYLSGGELFVSGRKKDMIIVGGKNIYPQDLEALSYEVPGVHGGRSVAFGVFNDETGTEDVYMVAEVESEDPREQDRLADLIRQHVTKNSAVALRYVKVVGPRWILKTSSGKTARGANREKFLSELERSQK
jgi:fatty-acyl-CoA synthase